MIRTLKFAQAGIQKVSSRSGWRERKRYTQQALSGRHAQGVGHALPLSFHKRFDERQRVGKFGSQNLPRSGCNETRSTHGSRQPDLTSPKPNTPQRRINENAIKICERSIRGYQASLKD